MQAKKQKQDDRYFLQVSKDLMRLGPELIYGPNSSTPSSKNTTNPDSLARNKKRGDLIITHAFQNHLRIAPDHFEELVVDELVSNTPVRGKGEAVSRKKNTSGSIQGEVGVVEEERGG